MDRVKIILAALVVAVMGVLSAQSDSVLIRDLKINMVREKPVIDGRMDDPCWRNAAVARDFKLDMQQGKNAQEQTEVRICYDADNLYLFWKIYESNMDGFKPGLPPDVQDRVEESEAVHLFLRYDDMKGFFRFVASGMGGMQDSLIDHEDLNAPGLSFDSPWVAKSGRFAGGWTVEMAIPFSVLGCGGRVGGTPKVGSFMRFNLGRKRAQGESSQWSMTSANWGNYGCYGKLIFDGLKDDITPSLEVARTSFSFGENRLNVTGRDTTIAGVFHYKFSNDKGVSEEKDLILKNDKLDFTLNVAAAGNWTLEMTYAEDGVRYYHGVYEFTLQDIVPFLEMLKNSMPRRLALASDPSMKNELQKLNEISSQYESGMTDWQKLNSLYESSRKIYDKIEFPLFLLEECEAGKPFAVKLLGSEVKVYPDRVPAAKPQPMLKLYSARNEIRSFQLLLIPGKDAAEITAIECSGLKDIAEVTFHKIEYSKTEIGNSGKSSVEPDWLLPWEKQQLEPGKLTPVFANVKIPRGTKPGVYRGEIAVKSGAAEIKREIEIQVFGFELPDEMSLRHNHWLVPRSFDTRVTPEVYENAMRVLQDYRSQTYMFDHGVLRPLIKIYYEEDGRFSFDFSGMNPYFAIGRKYHSNAYWSAMTCNYGAALYMFAEPKRKVIERKTGKQITLMDCPAQRDWIERYRQGKPEFDTEVELAIVKANERKDWKVFWDTNPMYRDYLKAYVKYLDEQGVSRNSYFELYDEAPQSEARWEEMILHHKFLKKFVPELRLFNYEVRPSIEIGGESAIGLVDGWAPLLVQCADRGEVEKIRERQQKYGEEFWFYVCGDYPGGTGKYTPFIWLYRPLAGGRILPWFAWQLQADGFHVNNFTMLVKYRDGKLIPCMRLAMLRDGMQDYEYFVLLRNLLRQVDAAKYPEWSAAAHKALEISPEIIATVYEWTHSMEKLDAKRQELAALIEAGLKIKE